MKVWSLALLASMSTGCALFGFRQPQAPPPPPTAAAPAAAPAPAAEPEPDLATVLLSGPKPTTPKPYGDVRPGWSAEQAAQALPTLDGNVVAKDVPTHTRATIRWSRDDGSVESLYMMIGRPDALEVATNSWGPAVEAKGSGDKTEHLWFDEAESLRAVMKPQGDGVALQVEPYQPVAKLLGEGEEIAFQSEHPLLGMTPEEIQAAYPELAQGEGESIRLEFGPTEYGDYFTRVHFHFDKKGRVRVYYFPLSYERHPEAKEEYRQLLIAKFGEAKPGKRLGRELEVFRAKGPRIEVSDRDGRLQVSVRTGK